MNALPTAQDRPAVLAALTATYARLGDMWGLAIGDTDCASDCPSLAWKRLDDRPDAWHQLLHGGESAAAAISNAVRGHLALLCRAYWPDLLDPAEDPIPFPAAYPPARAVLEATATASYVLDPALAPQDRAQRCAELLLWSQAATRRHDVGWHEVAAEAGFDVRAPRKRPDDRYVHTVDRARGVSVTDMITAVHGPESADLYREWNPTTHPDPIALAERATLRLRDGGYGVGGLIREDRDVEVAAHVADLVAGTIERQAVYFGRSAAPAEPCRAASVELRAFLPVVADQVNARNARARA